jgi:hypothetical protein
MRIDLTFRNLSRGSVKLLEDGFIPPEGERTLNVNELLNDSSSFDDIVNFVRVGKITVQAFGSVYTASDLVTMAYGKFIPRGITFPEIARYSVTEGDIFVRDDLNNMYYWDSTAWVELSPGAVGPHQLTHATGGADALSDIPGVATIAGGVDTVGTHAPRHEPGGADPINAISGGALIGGGPETLASHAVQHGNAGSDPLTSVPYGALVGLGPNTIGTHGSRHKYNGPDPIGNVHLFAGNPNGVLAGTLGDYCLDNLSGNIHFCTSNPFGVNWELSGAGRNYLQSYFIGKHGNNTYSGLNPTDAVLTFTQGIALATAQIPSVVNRFVLFCMDAGIYTENFTIPSWVSIYAPNAKIIGDVQLRNDSHFNAHEVESAGINAINKLDAAGSAIAEVNVVRATGATNGIINVVATSILIYHGSQVYVQNGVGIGGAAAAGHTHVDIEDIYVTGTGDGIASGLTGHVTAQIGNIEDTGSGTGIHVYDGQIDASVESINCQAAYIVDDVVFAVLNLQCNDLTGTETVGAIATASVMIPSRIKPLTNAGNPGGVVTGWLGEHCFDTLNGIEYVCTSNPSGTVWDVS